MEDEYLQHGIIVAQGRMMMSAASRAFMRVRQRRRLRRQSHWTKTADRRRFVHRTLQLFLGQLMKIRQGPHRFHPFLPLSLRDYSCDISSRAIRPLASHYDLVTAVMIISLICELVI